MHTPKTAQYQLSCLAALLFGALFFGACATAPLPAPTALIVPTPITGNTGAYLSPYTSDGVAAKWVDNAVKAELGAGIGEAAGSYLGAQAMGQVPLVGGLLGDYAGKAIGRGIAIKMAGGEDYMKQTSDLSFNSIDDLAVWMYATHSTERK